MEIKKMFKDKEWVGGPILKMLRMRNQYAGPGFHWVGMTEHGWGKCVFVNNGDRFVFGMPMSTCLASMAAATKGQVPDISALAEHFVALSPEQIISLGGFYIYLRQGQGVVIPPAYMVGMLGAFNMSSVPIDDTDLIPSDVTEPRLCF